MSTVASEHLMLDHWDPADRFIAATAREMDATLIDQRLTASFANALLETGKIECLSTNRLLNLGLG